MLLKCCTQRASKFGKLSCSHRPGKGQFSFQPQRRAMPKNIQTTAQLHSFHMRARSCSKSFKLGFNSMWTKNFQMCNLDLEKKEEPDIKLPTSIESQKKQRDSREKNIYLCFIDYAEAFDCVDHKKLENSSKDGNDRPLYCLLRNLCAGQEAIVKGQTWNNRQVRNRKRSTSRLYIVTLLI